MGLDDRCSRIGCERRRKSRGLCDTHYRNCHRAGTLPPLTPRQTLSERFWSKVNKTDGCWEWTAYRNPGGYGKTTINKAPKMAHRVAYELEVGPIPPGAYIDHVCHNPACVKPSHLRPATNKQNMENRSGLDGKNKSGERGVYWHEASRKWAAQVTHNGKAIYLGTFENKNEAAEASRKLRLSLFTHNDRDKQKRPRR